MNLSKEVLQALGDENYQLVTDLIKNYDPTTHTDSDESSNSQTLDLSYLSPREEGLIAIAQGLKNNAFITSINFDYLDEKQFNDLHRSGVAALSEALETNPIIVAISPSFLLSKQIEDRNLLLAKQSEEIKYGVRKNPYDSLDHAGWLGVDDDLKKLFQADREKQIFGNILLYNYNKYTKLTEALVSRNYKLIEKLISEYGESELDLRDSFISPKVAIAIARGLRANKNVTAIDLSGNEIGAPGARAMAALLKENKVINTIYFRNCQIGTEGSVLIFDALQENTSITDLDFSSNQIGNKGATALGLALKVNKSVTTLDLHNNQIHPVGIIGIAGALETNTSVTHLDLHNNRIRNEGAKALAHAIKKNILVNINLSNAEIRADGMIIIAGALAENVSLSSVNLDDNDLGVRRKTKSSNVNRFNLEDITALVAAERKDDRNNNDLDREKEVGDAISKALESNISIQEFFPQEFFNDEIKERNRVAIGEYREVKKDVTSISALNKVGMGMRPNTEENKNRTIPNDAFSIMQGFIGEPHWLKESALNNYNASKDSSNNNEDSDSDDDSKNNAKKKFEDFSTKIMKALKQRRYDIVENLIANNRSDRSLRLKGAISNEETEALIKALEKNNTITDFDFNNLRIGTDANSDVDSDYDSEDDIDNELEQKLMRKAKASKKAVNKKLSRGQEDEYHKASLEEKFASEGGENVYFSNLPADDDEEAKEEDDDFNKQVNEALKKGQYDLVESLISNNKNHKTLFIKEFIDNEAAESIAKSLKINKNLTSLSFRNRTSNCVLYPEYLAPIIEALAINNTLTHIDFFGNELFNCGRHIASIISQNKSLTSINLEWCKLEFNDMKLIFGALKNNTTLTDINLNNNPHGFDHEDSDPDFEAGMEIISKAIKENKTLTFLGLKHDKIDSKIIKYIARALTSNRTLTLLDISDSDESYAHGRLAMDSKSLKFLINALEDNTTLISLGLTVANPNSKEMQFLSKKLRMNAARAGTGNTEVEDEKSQYETEAEMIAARKEKEKNSASLDKIKLDENDPEIRKALKKSHEEWASKVEDDIKAARNAGHPREEAEMGQEPVNVHFPNPNTHNPVSPKKQNNDKSK